MAPGGRRGTIAWWLLASQRGTLQSLLCLTQALLMFWILVWQRMKGRVVRAPSHSVGVRAFNPCMGMPGCRAQHWQSQPGRVKAVARPPSFAPGPGRGPAWKVPGSHSPTSPHCLIHHALRGTGAQEGLGDPCRETIRSWPGQEGPVGTQLQELQVPPRASDALSGRGMHVGSEVSKTTFWYPAPTPLAQAQPRRGRPLRATGAE